MDGGGGGNSAWDCSVRHVGPHSRVLSFGPLVVTEVFGLMSAGAVDEAMEAVSKVGEAWGEVSQVVLFDAAEILRIPRSTKDRARSSIRGFQGYTRGAALVATGSGLGPTCFRAQLEKDNAFMHLGARHQVFDSLAPAMQFLSGLEGQHVPLRGVHWMRIVAELRALPARPSSAGLGRVGS